VGNVCDHADKYLFLCQHSENQKTEKEVFLSVEEYTCILRVCDRAQRKIFVPTEQGVTVAQHEHLVWSWLLNQ
jgi:hypothetical protein